MATRRDPHRPTAARMIEIVRRLRRARLVVVGDAILDTFELGEIARVSREAPVLILEHRHTTFAPGGAANAAANVAALGARVALLGRIGADDAGAQLKRLLAERGVIVTGLLADKGFVTPTKRRILAGGPHTRKQQIVRVDRGQRGVPVTAALRARLAARVRALRARGATLLLADYGYGLIDPEWSTRLARGPGEVLLDSRFALERFHGIDAATPNLEELERAGGRKLLDDDERGIAAAGEKLRRRAGAQALLVTRGSRGMTLVQARHAAAFIPVFGSDEVADVTGAGDTVIAVFGAARAAGATWREAAELANVAGGLVVMKSGTATVSPTELAAAIQAHWDA